MAIRHRLVNRPADAVWSLLADPERYRSFVPGTVETSRHQGTWPEVGSALSYRVGFGRLSAQGRTVVRICEPPRRLELEAYLGRMGSARIAFQLVSWGRDTLVIVDEHPLRGPGARMHAAPVELLLHLRHRLLLGRLASTAEHTAQPPRRRSRAARTDRTDHVPSGGARRA
jgi:carbon monoxide dehydrogenase subunit G